LCLRRPKNLHKEKISRGLDSLLNLIINGGNVEFGLGDADFSLPIVRSTMFRSNPNLVIGWDLFVDAKASEGVSTGLNCTPCVYGFELQVSKATASTLVTVSWFILVLGRYRLF
jgi:hypothetical protein